jgi:hypothetical protein
MLPIFVGALLMVFASAVPAGPGSSADMPDYDLLAAEGLDAADALQLQPESLSAASSSAAPFLDRVQEVYIAYYQRPADPAGLVWWSQQLGGVGGNLSAIIDAFASSDESRELYGVITSQSIRAVINSMYQALFDRQAEPAGLAYYENGFNTGRFTPGTIALNILDGALNEDADAIGNKLGTSNLFSRMLDPNLTGNASDLKATNYRGLSAEVNGRSFLRPVTALFESFPRTSEIRQFILDYFTNTGDPILTDDQVPTAIAEVDSSAGGRILSTDGSELQLREGAISRLPDGSAGRVSFSVERVAPEQSPGALPSGYQQIGPIHLIGPAGFVFAQPTQVWFPAEEADSPADLVVLWFNDSTRTWKPLITNDLDPAQRRLGVTVLRLGYFVVARSDLLANPEVQGAAEPWESQASLASISPSASIKRVGGIKMTHISTLEPLLGGYYYNICIGAVAYTYPEVGWPNLVGDGVGTGSYTTGGPLGETHMENIPQGLYTFIISREKAGTLSNSPGPWQTLSVPVQVNVGPFSEILGGWGSVLDVFSGWTDVSGPVAAAYNQGATWQLTGPGGTCGWPEPTVPYGTGALNITLEWVNTQDSYADIDLHLYGPGGIHVYYSSKDVGALHLDRDWQSTLGNATENLYSSSPPLPGDYRVAVDHWGGSLPKSCTVRVKVGTAVRTYRLDFANGDEQEVERFTL